MKFYVTTLVGPTRPYVTSPIMKSGRGAFLSGGVHHVLAVQVEKEGAHVLVVHLEENTLIMVTPNTLISAS
jgi:hypothetical protein